MNIRLYIPNLHIVSNRFVLLVPKLLLHLFNKQSFLVIAISWNVKSQSRYERLEDSTTVPLPPIVGLAPHFLH
jgi:hypothetical protein